jgi:hypothetical protein
MDETTDHVALWVQLDALLRAKVPKVSRGLRGPITEAGLAWLHPQARRGGETLHPAVDRDSARKSHASVRGSREHPSRTMAVMRRALLTLLCVTLPLAIEAQDADPFERAEQLEQAVAAHPEDTRLLCDYGWALVRIHDDEASMAISSSPGRARGVLDRGIALLGTPTEPALRQRLGACLYSRGRLAEHESLADAIPFYERSIAVRPNAVVSARLAAARSATAAGWAATERHHTSDAPDPPAELGSITSVDALVLGRWRSAAGDEVVVLFDDAHFYVASRPAGGAWRALPFADLDAEDTAQAAWIEAPSSGERLRVVAIHARQSRVTMDDGPVWLGTAVGTTVAIGADGTPTIVQTDPWSP